MSRTRCEHGVLIEAPCFECATRAAEQASEGVKRDIRLTGLLLENSRLLLENSKLRHDLANAQQVALFAQELLHMGEVLL